MPLSGCWCIASVTPYNLTPDTCSCWSEAWNQEGLSWITWMHLLSCRKRKEENLNLDRSSLLFFFSEDLSYAAAPTKTPTGETLPVKVLMASPPDESVLQIHRFIVLLQAIKSGKLCWYEWKIWVNMTRGRKHDRDKLTLHWVTNSVDCPELQAALNLSAFPDTHPVLVS